MTLFAIIVYTVAVFSIGFWRGLTEPVRLDGYRPTETKGPKHPPKGGTGAV